MNQKSGFDWIPFYEELASNLVSYDCTIGDGNTAEIMRPLQ